VNAEPLWFGPLARPLFGWLHRPAAPGALTAGIVICNPFGNEALCAHRSIRHLARAAAAAGFAALRFDYDGSGDSAGHCFELQRLAAWLASVNEAIDTLRETTGVGRVYLAGFRLGATIAALACLGRRDLSGLIAIAPVVNGGAYVRELRLLQRAMDAKREVNSQEHAGYLESCGFLLTTETQTELRAIDLTRLSAAPCERILVLDRAEMPVDLALVPAWRARGATVERRAVRGYTEMMLDPHDSAVPEELIAATLHWLRAQESAAVAAPAVASAPSAAAARSPRVRATLAAPAVPDPVTAPDAGDVVGETLLEFGGDVPLFGVLTTPAAPRPTAADHRPTVVLLNAGAVHHVGPNRMYVTFARHLARLGHSVLRLDIAGIGDSDPRPGEAENVVYAPAALRDLHSALEFLHRQRGAGDLRVIGLCSGAYHAFKGAVQGLPLQAVVAVNPLSFFWKEGMSLKYPQHRIAADVLRYRSKVLSGPAWRKLIAGEVDLLGVATVLGQRLASTVNQQVRTVSRLLGKPLAEDLPTELQRAAAATQLQFVFSAGDPGTELLRHGAGFTARRLRERGQLIVTTVAGADHTFTDLGTRRALIAVLTQALRVPARTRPQPEAPASTAPGAPLKPYS
jgi:predicted alpha/beta hydrolase